MMYSAMIQRMIHQRKKSNQISFSDIWLIYKPAKAPVIRGCTGFDGDLEIMEAIDGPGPSKNLEININADNQLAYAA